MKQLLKRHALIIGLCALFFGVAALLGATWYKYQLNPDASSYMTIAQKYAHGDFVHAINGYWGPLLSWLLVPFVWLHVNLIIAAKLLAALAGVGILVVAYCYLRDRKVSLLLNMLCCTAVAALMLEWAVVEAITPDMLLAFLIVLFAVRFGSFLAEPSRSQGIILGVIGALMYYGKGFGFFLFLGAVGLVALWEWWRIYSWDWRVVRDRYLPLALTFAVLVLPFIGIISVKYHRPTINNAGSYDHRAHGYNGARTADIPPIIDTAGPLAPPNATAISAWEDPSRITPLVPNWSPLGSHAELKYFIFGTIGKNLNNIIRYIYGQGPIAVIGIGVLLAGWLQRRLRQTEYAIFALVTVLMICGYSLVLAEGRYMWATIALGAMGSALWFSQLEKRKLLNTLQISLAGVVVIGLALLSTGQVIAQTKYTDREMLQLSDQLRPLLPQDSHVVTDDFERSYHVCYYLTLRCYNILAPPSARGDQAYYRLLKKDHVSYYLYFSKAPLGPPVIDFVHEHFSVVGTRAVAGAKVVVYKLN